MTSQKWMIALGIAAPVALFAIIWIACGDRFVTEPLIPIATVILCATTAGFMLTGRARHISPGTDSWLASIGVRTTFGLIAIGVALLGLVVAVVRLDTLAIILDILSVLAALVAFVVSAMVGQHTDEVGEQKNFASAHLVWRDRLAQIATQTSDDEIRATITVVADNARYLARDAQRASTPVNDEISALIDQLNTAVTSGTPAEVTALAARIEQKFGQREGELAAARRKA